MTWPIVALGTLVNIQTGKLDANAASTDGEYPFFTCAREPLRINRWRFDLDAVLVAGNGDLNVKHYTGKFEAYQRTYVISSREPKLLDIRYLFHFMDKYVERLREQSIGGIIKYIKLGMLTDAEIPLPPLEEQKRIVAILDQADALHRLRRRALHRLNTLGQAIFHEMFGRKEDWPARYKMTKLESLCRPKQWKTISSAELTEQGFPVYGANGVIGFYTEFNHEVPTVLITCRGATCGTINVCAPRSYVTGNAMALNDPEESRITLPFLEWCLRVRGVDDAISGSAQPQITRQSLSTVSIPEPPLVLQQEFADRLEAVQVLRERLEPLYDRTEILFTSLQHSAFRGEL